jgi:hypothetical protein
LAYLASFGYIAVIWVNHHDLFTRIRAVDAGPLWRNLLLLLTSFLPFPTAVLSTAFQHGTRADQVAALVLYCALAAAMGTRWLTIFDHLCHRPRLLAVGTPPEFFAAERGRSLVGIAAYAVAAGSAAWQPPPRPGDRRRPHGLLRRDQPGMEQSPISSRNGRGRARRRLRRPASTPARSPRRRGTALLRVFLMVVQGGRADSGRQPIRRRALEEAHRWT